MEFFLQALAGELNTGAGEGPPLCEWHHSVEVNRLHVGVEGWGRNSEVCGEGMSYMNLSYQCSLVLEPFMSNTCTLEQTRLLILGKPPLPLCAVSQLQHHSQNPLLLRFRRCSGSKNI